MGCGQDRAVAEREPHRSFLREVGESIVHTASDIPAGLVATLGLGSSAPRLDRYGALRGLSGAAGARRRSTSAGEDPWSEVEVTHEAAYEWSVSTGTCQLCCSKPETCGSRKRYECGCGPLPNPTLDRPRLRPDCGVDHPEYLFDLPTSNEWGSVCAFTSSTSECAGVRPLELETDCAEFTCPDDAWGDLVVVHDCGTFESFVREAWCLLVANSDILTWLTCLIYGEDWSRDLTNKLLGGNTDRGVTTGPSSRVEFTCDRVGRLPVVVSRFRVLVPRDQPLCRRLRRTLLSGWPRRVVTLLHG